MATPSRILGGGEHADPQVLGLVTRFPVHFHHPVGETERETAPDDALDVDPVGKQLDRRFHLAGELHRTDAQRPAAPRCPGPAKEKPGQLPQCIQTKTPRHDRIAREMAFEEPQVGPDVRFRHEAPFAVRTAVVRDVVLR